MLACDPRPWLRNAGQTLGLGEGSLGSDTTRLVEQQWIGLVGGLDLPHVASWMLTGNGLFSLQLAGTCSDWSFSTLPGGLGSSSIPSSSSFSQSRIFIG